MIHETLRSIRDDEKNYYIGLRQWQIREFFYQPICFAERNVKTHHNWEWDAIIHTSDLTFISPLLHSRDRITPIDSFFSNIAFIRSLVIGYREQDMWVRSCKDVSKFHALAKLRSSNHRFEMTRLLAEIIYIQIYLCRERGRWRNREIDRSRDR